MVQLQPHIEAFRERGAELYVIGSGLPLHVEGFRETTGYTGQIYTDPSLKVFDQAQLVRSALGTFGPRAVIGGFKSMRRGLRQGKTQGDALQQGGALVVGRGGTLRFHHQSRVAGDNVAPELLLSALEQQETAPPDFP